MAKLSKVQRAKLNKLMFTLPHLHAKRYALTKFAKVDYTSNSHTHKQQMYKGAVYMFCIDYTLLFNLPDNGFRTRNLLEC